MLRLEPHRSRQPGRVAAQPHGVLLRSVAALSRLGLAPSLPVGAGACLFRLRRSSLRPALRVDGATFRLVQPLGVAHLRALAQRTVLTRQDTLAFLGGSLLGLQTRSLGPDPFELRLDLALLTAHPLVLAVRLSHRPRAPPRRDGRVGAVVPQERVGRAEGRAHALDAEPLLLEAAERLRDVGHDGLVDRRQRLRERGRQRLLVGALGQLGLAELDQEVDERAVPFLPEAEQRLVDGAPVRLPGLVHVARPSRLDRVPQPVLAQDRPRLVHQPKLSDPLRRREVPGLDDAPPGRGLEPDAERAEVLGPVGVDPSELDPRVARPLGVRVCAAEQQVPLHALLRVRIRLHASRVRGSVEQERQRQREHLRLAGAVVPAHQQAPVVEPELFVVVVEEVDQSEA